MSTTAEQLDLAAVNSMLERAHPAKIIEWTLAQYGREVVSWSSFGAESAVLLHLAATALPGIKVVMVDTGYLFPETHAFMERLRKRFDLNVWVYRTQNDPIAYLHHAGEENPQWRKDVDSCCGANKNEPMERAMKELAPKAYFRGVRRNQASTREAMQVVEFSARYNSVAVSPILNWGGREIFAYMKEHDLPHHPLVEKGYLSIGCNPLSCTRTVMPGEDARSGRWAGQDKVECGLNLTSMDSANL